MDEIGIFRQKLIGIDIKRSHTPFSILNIMYKDIVGKEVLQSKIIGGLLDPNENHDFGDVPLLVFLEMAFEKKFEINKDSGFLVSLERTVCPVGKAPRRIDILLEWKDTDNEKHAIIIENKLNWAENQTDQLNDYYDCIKNEGYTIEGLIYMPFSSEYQHSKDTGTREDILKKTVDFDVEKLIGWLDKCFSNYPNDEKASTLREFKLLWECLIDNKYAKMKALEIIGQLTDIEIEKIENLAKLVATPEWCEARFNEISNEIKSAFNGNLNISYKKWKDGRDYAEFYFDGYKYWVELWFNNNTIDFYVVSKDKEEDPVTLNGMTFSYSSFEKYYYYRANKYNYYKDEVIGIAISILKELDPTVK